MFHAFKFQTNKFLRYYIICLALYMFPKGTAHSFLLVSDGYIDNRDSGNLITEVKAGSGRGGGCITVVADPLQHSATLPKWHKQVIVRVPLLGMTCDRTLDRTWVPPPPKKGPETHGQGRPETIGYPLWTDTPVKTVPSPSFGCGRW